MLGSCRVGYKNDAADSTDTDAEPGRAVRFAGALSGLCLVLFRELFLALFLTLTIQKD